MAVDGRVHIANDPPLVTHASDAQICDHLHTLLRGYLASLPDERRALLDRYTLLDFARKVVGIGSVGTRCYILLFQGASAADPLFLQIKEAAASVLEPHLGRSGYAHHGERVVHGQRRIQAASDIFLGWGHVASTDYYIRQLADMKGSVNVAAMSAADMIAYAQICGWALARAHARSGPAARISSYLGRSAAFERAITAFAVAYADQTERDHATLVAAVRAGQVPAEPGV
jgi:uncharacterized protein (DUF2252 family)